MLIGEIVTKNARHAGDALALVESRTGLRRSWAELEKRTNRLALGLARLGLGKGDRAAIVSENSIACAEFYFAVAKIGVIGCALNYRLQPAQLARHLQRALPRAIFCQGAFEALAREAAGNLSSSIHRIDGVGGPSAYEALIAASPATPPDATIAPGDPLMITYSSGTTGLPKGVIATHRNRIAYAEEACRYTERYRHDDVVLNSAPFCAGVSGQAQLGAAALAGAATVMDVLSPATWADTVAQQGVTALVTTKSRLIPVREHLAASRQVPDFRSIRRVTIGGQAHSIEELRAILAFLGLSSCAKMYGTSETTAAGTRLLDAEVAAGLAVDATEVERRRLLSVGRALPGMQVSVLRADGGGDAPPNEVGEILLRGDCVSPGYWDDHSLTQRCFRDGGFRTGDMGLLDADGFLHLRGRRDYMIRTGGFQVAPIEVEQVILEHPAVLQVAVVGAPDERWGEAVTAVVRPVGGEAGFGRLEEELRAYCRERLAGYQVPKRWLAMDRLPTDEQGRIDLKAVRALAAGSLGA